MQRTISLCLAAALMTTMQAVKVEEGGEWVPNACQQEAMDNFEKAVEQCKVTVVVDDAEVAECQAQCAEDDGGCKWMCEHHDPFQYCIETAYVTKKHALDMCWVNKDKEFQTCNRKLKNSLKKKHIQCLKKHERKGTDIENAKADCWAQREQQEEAGMKECKALYEQW